MLFGYKCLINCLDKSVQSIVVLKNTFFEDGDITHKIVAKLLFNAISQDKHNDLRSNN